jgi:vacuolar-type H+-ATPase subunit C/Vma6
MKVRTPTGLDFLGARLHARRGRLAEADRLDTFCRIRAVPELIRALESDTSVHTIIDLQRRLVTDLLTDLQKIGRQTEGPAGDLMDWLAVRLQVENLKVVARAFATHTPYDQVKPHILPLAGELAIDGPALVASDSLEAFMALVPHKALRGALHDVLALYRAQLRPFFIEAALDSGYFFELLQRVAVLSDDERDEVLPLARQEVDLFHLMLVTRGKFLYGLKPEQLTQFHVRGTKIPADRFSAMLAAPDLTEVGAQAVGRVIDSAPRDAGGQAAGQGGPDPSILEVLAWQRYLRLANTTFRRSHMGLGAVVAFAAIRRIEVANLITLSEGIRTGVAPEVLRRRLIPRSDLEAARA